MFVGGEFYYDGRWTLDAPSISTEGMIFLNGGRACLTVISDYLRDHAIGKILLPSYLCPSILNVFERRGIQWAFYQVNEDLSIDLADLLDQAKEHRAVYFINYFGFQHAPKTIECMKVLQQQGVIAVEDNAQAGFLDHPTGDFILNSIRKFAPHDGGYLITPRDVTPYLDPYRGLPNRRLPIIRAYRELLYHYLYEDSGNHRALEAMFNQAEQYYDDDLIVLGDPQEQAHIEQLDWHGIKAARRENYQYLLSLIPAIPEIRPIFPTLQADHMPLGLPVYFSSAVLRDRVYEELGNAGIGLSIHWEDIPADSRTNQNRLSVEMASRMLTLVIDQRTSHKQMDYLAITLAHVIEQLKPLP